MKKQLLTEQVESQLQFNYDAIQLHQKDLKFWESKFDECVEKNQDLKISYFKSKQQNSLTPETEERYNKAKEEYDNIIENMQMHEQCLNEFKQVRTILINNYYVAFIQENEQKIIDTLNKYAGKQFGEKTKLKIWNDLRNIDPDIYLCENYRDKYCIKISKFRYNSCELFEFVFIDKNNKILKIEENKKCIKMVYIKDVAAYLKLLKKYQEKIQKQYKEMEETIDKFNKNSIVGFNEISIYDDMARLENFKNRNCQKFGI